MRHHSNKRKFGREKDVRNALMRLLAENMLRRGKMRTTLAKAKELRPFVEKLITKSKRTGTRVNSSTILGMAKAIGEKSYKDRNGGYVRITKLPARKSDAAKMAVIEFV